MSASDYERYRQRLEEQLRADIEVLHQAHRVKLLAYETVARARGELVGEAPAAAAAAAPATGAAPVVAAAPAPRAAPASPPTRRRRRAYALYDDIKGALPKVGEVFDKFDLYRILGYEPNRASLYRMLEELIQEGTLVIHQAGSGKRATRYRKTAPAATPREAPGEG